MARNYAFSLENDLYFCLSPEQILLAGPDCMAQVSFCQVITSHQVLFQLVLWVALTRAARLCPGHLLPSCLTFFRRSGLHSER